MTLQNKLFTHKFNKMDKRELAIWHFILAIFILMMSNAANYNHKIIYISSGIIALWGVLILIGNHVRLEREKEIKNELFSINAHDAAEKSKENHHKNTIEHNQGEKERIYKMINNAVRSGYFEINVYYMPHEALHTELIQKGFIIEPYQQDEILIEPYNYTIKWQ